MHVRAWLSGPFSNQIWGRYGVVDSLDLDRHWFAQNVYGITVGPEFLSFANLSAQHSVWSAFSQIPEIRKAMDRIRTNALMADSAP